MRSQWGVVGVAGMLLTGSAALADAKSDALIQQAFTTAKKATSLMATVVTTVTKDGATKTHTAAVRLLKPNLAQVSVFNTDPAKQMLLLLTGKDAYLVVPVKKQYQQLEKVTDAARSPLSNVGTPLASAFFDDQVLKSLTAIAKVTYAGKKTISGVAYDAVLVKRAKPSQLVVTAYFGPSGLCERMELTIPPPIVKKAGAGTARKPSGRVIWWFKDLKLNTPIPASEFVYTPPAGYTRMQQQQAPIFPTQ